MAIAEMKDELHKRLWAAQERWLKWKEEGRSKHELKIEGLKSQGDLFALTRYVLFTGATRVTYERELKRFIDFAHEERGRRSNQEIDKKDFRAYMEHLLQRGTAAKELSSRLSQIALMTRGIP